MKKLIFILVVLVFLMFSLSLHAGVVNKDKPLKGEWNLQPEKVWEVEEVTDGPLARPGKLLVAHNGALLFSDRKYNKSFIFSQDGKLIRGFAPKGEGPGEIKMRMEHFLAHDYYVIADFERLHYFTLGGEFVRTVPNHFFRRKPDIFLTPDEIISTPVNVRNLKENKVAIRKINLKTNEAQVISEYELWTGGSVSMEGLPRREVRISGLSPMMILGRGEGRFYYGHSDVYTITACGLDGKKLFSFSLDRKKKSITRQQKKELLSGLRNMSDVVLNYLMKHFPQERTYFYRIEEHNGLIYVHVPDPLHRMDGHQPLEQIDIFSKDGKYLYKARLNLGEGIKAFRIVFHGSHLFTFTEDEEEGDIKLVKYKIKLPQ